MTSALFTLGSVTLGATSNAASGTDNPQASSPIVLARRTLHKPARRPIGLSAAEWVQPGAEAQAGSPSPPTPCPHAPTRPTLAMAG